MPNVEGYGCVFKKLSRKSASSSIKILVIRTYQIHDKFKAKGVGPEVMVAYVYNLRDIN